MNKEVKEIVTQLENEWFNYVYSSEKELSDERERQFYEEKVKQLDKELRTKVIKELGYV